MAGHDWTHFGEELMMLPNNPDTNYSNKNIILRIFKGGCSFVGNYICWIAH